MAKASKKAVKKAKAAVKPVKQGRPAKAVKKAKAVKAKPAKAAKSSKAVKVVKAKPTKAVKQVKPAKAEGPRYLRIWSQTGNKNPVVATLDKLTRSARESAVLDNATIVDLKRLSFLFCFVGNSDPKPVYKVHPYSKFIEEPKKTCEVLRKPRLAGAVSALANSIATDDDELNPAAYTADVNHVPEAVAAAGASI